MAVSHIPVNFGLGHQRRHGVHYHNVNSAGTHHRLCDLQGLLSVVRLGNIEVVYIHADVLGINRIQGMLGIDKSGNSAPLLYLGNHM